MELYHAQQKAHAWLARATASCTAEGSKDEWSSAVRLCNAADEALAAATDSALTDMGITPQDTESSPAAQAEGNLKHADEVPWTLVAKKKGYPDTSVWPAPQPAHKDDQQKRKEEADYIALKCNEEQLRRAGGFTRDTIQNGRVWKTLSHDASVTHAYGKMDVSIKCTQILRHTRNYMTKRLRAEDSSLPIDHIITELRSKNVNSSCFGSDLA